VVEEELGVGGSKTTVHSDASGWEDVEEEDEALAHLDDIENGHPMEGLEGGAVITVSNFPILLMILLTVSRILDLLRSASFKLDGRRPRARARIF
jgi:hypothetical protein